jgi:hypothetical protein
LGHSATAKQNKTKQNKKKIYIYIYLNLTVMTAHRKIVIQMASLGKIKILNLICSIQYVPVNVCIAGLLFVNSASKLLFPI